MKNHTILIGGNKGIGLTVARTLQGMGHTLSIIARSQPSEKETDDSSIFFQPIDITDLEKLEKGIENILSQRGKINHLIFFQRFRGKDDDWSGEISTSLTATKNIIQLLAKEFSKTGSKSITVVGSKASHLIFDEQPVSYHVAKGGLLQLVRYFAITLGPLGIRVNSISPGITIKEENSLFYKKESKLYNLYKNITPLQRMGTADDIADLVSFLCSKKSSFITGQDIVVDGGVSLQGQESLACKISSLNHL